MKELPQALNYRHDQRRRTGRICISCVKAKGIACQVVLQREGDLQLAICGLYG
jgi:hypothetical protein